MKLLYPILPSLYCATSVASGIIRESYTRYVKDGNKFHVDRLHTSWAFRRHMTRHDEVLRCQAKVC